MEAVWEVKLRPTIFKYKFKMNCAMASKATYVIHGPKFETSNSLNPNFVHLFQFDCSTLYLVL